MPTYLYSCDECDKEIEIFKSIALSDKVETCEECDKELTKIFSSTFSIKQKGYCYNNNERSKQNKESSTT